LAEDAGVSGLPGEIEDGESAAEMVVALEEASAAEGADPALATLLADAQALIEAGSDPDGDEISTGAEATVTSQMAEAAQRTIPTQVAVILLDPTNPASVGGEPDLRTATIFVGNLDSLRVNLSVTTENQDTLLESEEGGLEYLEQSQDATDWEIDFEGVATAMDGSVEEAMRAVGIFNARCARCHTAGFSAGIPFTLEAGSGGFGPALWDGRPIVQFGDATEEPADDLLLQFLVRGSEPATPYGINGVGTGRMPAFGALLSAEDLELLARYLRSGNLDGVEE
jgi:mono/diheme cytochrome c family protein